MYAAVIKLHVLCKKTWIPVNITRSLIGILWQEKIVWRKSRVNLRWNSRLSMYMGNGEARRVAREAQMLWHGASSEKIQKFYMKRVQTLIFLTESRENLYRTLKKDILDINLLYDKNFMQKMHERWVASQTSPLLHLNVQNYIISTSPPKESSFWVYLVPKIKTWFSVPKKSLI